MYRSCFKHSYVQLQTEYSQKNQFYFLEYHNTVSNAQQIGYIIMNYILVL
jgi:hypothetical protein